MTRGAAQREKVFEPIRLLSDEETGLPLFPFQAVTIAFGSGDIQGTRVFRGVKVIVGKPGRVILDVDPGLGKSRMALSIAVNLAASRRIIVLCSKKALNTWRREWAKWTDLPSNRLQIIEGTPAKRAKQWANPTAQVFVVTYGSAQNDYEKHIAPKNFRTWIADECKIWRNYKNKSFKFWSKVLRNLSITDHIIMAEGTLVLRGPQDLWPYLHISYPKSFPGFWKFANAFCLTIEGPFGKEFVGTKNPDSLADILSSKVVRIRDSDPGIKEQRPPLLRDKIYVEPTKEQQSLYATLTKDLIAINSEGEVIAAPNALSLVTKHRQILICPKILDPSMGYGAAIDDLILRLEDDPHVVIFTPFTKAIPFIRDAIRWAKHPEPYILQGGASSDDIRKVEEGFDSSAAKDRACLVSTSFGESFELPSAKQAFHVGFSWSQRDNYQADKRLHRLNTPHPIISWYYMYEDTVDDRIFDRLNEKQFSVRTVYQHYISIARQLYEGETQTT